MYEESIRFFMDLFQRNGSVLEVLDADHTFVNEALARHYGIPNVNGPEWRRVDGIKSLGRGGILGMATLLSKQSGASRTSPILRGNWFVEMLLGEKLPKPPKNVPVLPESELDTNGLTMRQITERHRETASCASVTTGSIPSASRSKHSTPSVAEGRTTWRGAPSTPTSSSRTEPSSPISRAYEIMFSSIVAKTSFDSSLGSYSAIRWDERSKFPTSLYWPKFSEAWPRTTTIFNPPSRQ